MHLVRPTDPAAAVVVRNDVCTSRKAAGFVRHIDVDVSGTPLAGEFRAGQSFGVLPPGVDDAGKPHKVRLYSIAAPTSGENNDNNILSTTVKRVIDEHWDDHRLFLGVASNYLCDCQPGDKIMVSGPNGKRFLLPADVDNHDFLFIATGTGIAPFRGMLLDLLQSQTKSRITLIMGSPYATDLLYHDFFTDLAHKHDNFTYITALSRQPQEDGQAPMYVQQRIPSDRETLLPLLTSGRALIYICGIAGMELGIFQELARLLKGNDALDQYLQCEAPVLEEVDSWTRRMIHRELKPTRKVFMEVY